MGYVSQFLGFIYHHMKNHKLAFMILLSIWICGGYLLYSNRHSLFARLSHYLASSSRPYRSVPVKAHQYLKQAQLYLQENKVNLKIMENSCVRIPQRYKGSPSDFQPDWLERLQEWQLHPVSHANESGGQWKNVAEFPDYWVKKYPFVLKSLNNTANALRFSYEIPASIAISSSKEKLQGPVVVMHFLASYAKALCRPHLAILGWGDYVSFQEERAKRQLLKRNKVATKEAVLSSLKGNPLYTEALYGHLGQSPSSQNEIDISCEQQKGASLFCLDLGQAIVTYHKLLKVEANTFKPRLHLRLAQAYLQERKQFNERRQANARLAIQHLKEATRAYALEAKALMLIAHIQVEQKNYEQALQTIQRLYPLHRSLGFNKEAFSMLAKKTLTGLGRLRDGDCFTQMNATLLQSKATHCSKVKIGR